MAIRIRRLFNRHFEWVALTAGLLLMAMMNPHTSGTSFCLFEWAGIPFCPGHGLGHSIAYIFRGDFNGALHANVMGILAVIVIPLRILTLLRQRFLNKEELLS